MLGGHSSRAVAVSVGAGGDSPGRRVCARALWSRSDIGPTAAGMWAARGRVEGLGWGVWRGHLPGSCWGVQPFRGRQSSRLPLRWGHPEMGLSWRGWTKQPQMWTPLHCKACECQTAGSSHRLPPGLGLPSSSLPRVRDPRLLTGGHSRLGFGQIMGALIGGTGLLPTSPRSPP